jgi:MshEN domain
MGVDKMNNDALADQLAQNSSRSAAPEPMYAFHAEADRIVQRLEQLIKERRGDPPAPSHEPAVSPMPVEFPSEVVGARHSGRLLGTLLVLRAYVTPADVQHALAKQRDLGLPLGRTLVELGLLEEQALTDALAEQLRIETIDLDRTTIDPAMRDLLSRADARRLCALPIRRTADGIDVAIGDPTKYDAVGELIRVLRAPVRLFLAAPIDIIAAIDRFYADERRDA